MVISVREVFNELHNYNDEDMLQDWAKTHKAMFNTPDAAEMQFVGTIFSVPHFQANISQKSLLRGTPVADPFVIAAAKVRQGSVVTQELKKPNAAKIPNICEHFGIPWMNFESFMETVDWKF